jgi:quercetin dioxygenase-like cupin family protein
VTSPYPQPEAQTRGRAAWLAMPLPGEQTRAGATVLKAGEGEVIEIGDGRRVIVKVSPEVCDGQLELHMEKLAPRMLVPAHMHRRAAQYSIVMSGVLCFQVGDEDPHVLQEGDIIWRPPGVVHAVWNPDRDRDAWQAEGTMPGSEMLALFRAMRDRNMTTDPDAPSLAETARPLGIFFDAALTERIEREHGVSAARGGRQ